VALPKKGKRAKSIKMSFFKMATYKKNDAKKSRK
jgi:hypothetical protein